MSLAQRCSGIANRAASLGQQNHNSQERRGFDNEQHETTLRYRVAVNDDLERIWHQPLGELGQYRRQEGEQQNREPPHERSPQSIGAAAGLKSRRPLRTITPSLGSNIDARGCRASQRIGGATLWEASATTTRWAAQRTSLYRLSSPASARHACLATLPRTATYAHRSRCRPSCRLRQE